MKRVIITEEQHKCLREHLKAIENILSGGSKPAGRVSERRAGGPEPTQKERVNNYATILDSDQKYQKPKHLRK